MFFRILHFQQLTSHCLPSLQSVSTQPTMLINKMKAPISICLLFLSAVRSFSPSKLNQKLLSGNAGLGFGTLKHSGYERVTVVLLGGKVGVFFGTSTGSTEGIADMICDVFDGEADGPFEVDEIQGSVAKKFAEYDALIVGTPTWNTGADTERSGTGWDEIYYGEMQGKIQLFIFSLCSLIDSL